MSVAHLSTSLTTAALGKLTSHTRWALFAGKVHTVLQDHRAAARTSCKTPADANKMPTLPRACSPWTPLARLRTVHTVSLHWLCRTVQRYRVRPPYRRAPGVAPRPPGPPRQGARPLHPLFILVNETIFINKKYRFIFEICMNFFVSNIMNIPALFGDDTIVIIIKVSIMI